MRVEVVPARNAKPPLRYIIIPVLSAMIFWPIASNASSLITPRPVINARMSSNFSIIPVWPALISSITA